MTDTNEATRNNGNETGYRKPPVEHQFKPGNPGRPKGSRNKLSESFLSDMHEVWQEHGKAAILEAREKDPVAFVRTVASILPKIVQVDDARDLTDDELNAQLRAVAAQLAEFAGIEGGLVAAVAGEETPPRPN